MISKHKPLSRRSILAACLFTVVAADAVAGGRYFEVTYHQEEKDNCRLWCDPRNGSHKTFLKCLADLAVNSAGPRSVASKAPITP